MRHAMGNSGWLLALFLTLSACSPGRAADSAPAPANKRPPNIVFIFADDLGYGDLACYGHPYMKSPALDQLAKDGTRFRQFYATGVTCCPARTGFMTGKFPASFQKYPADHGFDGRVTVTETLKKNGYQTGHFGKWHIGPDAKPGVYGIDETHTEAGGSRNDPRGRDAHIFDDAIRFVEAHKAGPFYVNVWCHTSHNPVNPPASYPEKFKDLALDLTVFGDPMREKLGLCKKLGGDPPANLRNYMGDVCAMDEGVARLLKKLDDLGLRENTIVVFSSDQGPGTVRLGKDREEQDAAEDGRANLRLNLLGNTGGLRGGKHEMYEGGVRVPFIVRWPGHVPANRVDETSVISGADWFPTLCKIAGISVEGIEFDGEDASAAWQGQAFARGKPLFWKTSTAKSEMAMREKNWKLVTWYRNRGETELYDLSADAGETKNVAGEHPEVVKEMLAKVQKWNETLPKEYAKIKDKED